MTHQYDVNNMKNKQYDNSNIQNKKNYNSNIQNKQYLICPINDINKKKNIKKEYTKLYILGIIIKHIQICLRYNKKLTMSDFNTKQLLNIIIYLYNNKLLLVDGANLAMSTIDKDIYGYVNSYTKKHYLRRKWENVGEFINKNNLIVVLRDCIFKYPRITEKKINFLKLFQGKSIWLSCGNKKIDDIYIIIITSILTILNKKTYCYLSNDNFADHSKLIDTIYEKLHSSIKQIKYKYDYSKGFLLTNNN